MGEVESARYQIAHLPPSPNQEPTNCFKPGTNLEPTWTFYMIAYGWQEIGEGESSSYKMTQFPRSFPSSRANPQKIIVFLSQFRICLDTVHTITMVIILPKYTRPQWQVTQSNIRKKKVHKSSKLPKYVWSLHVSSDQQTLAACIIYLQSRYIYSFSSSYNPSYN